MAIPSIDVSGFGDFTRGMQSGGNLFQQMMQPVMQQRGMQQADIHHKNNLGFKMQQLEKQALQHKQNLGISLQQLQMAQDLQPWQVKNLQAKVQYHQAQADALANEQNMLSQILSGQFGGMPASPQASIPGNASGQPGVSAPPMNQVMEGFAKPQMHPAAAAIMKKKFGYDPNALTEPEKSAQRMNEFRAKEQYKQDQKANIDRSVPTETTRTANQKVVIASDAVIPLLNDLIKEDTPGKIASFFKRDQASKTTGMANLAIDELGTIFNLPKDKHSTELAEQMVKPQFGESSDAYKKRLRDLKKRIEHRRDAANSILKGSKVGEKVPEKKADTEESANEKVWNPKTRNWE